MTKNLKSTPVTQTNHKPPLFSRSRNMPDRHIAPLLLLVLLSLAGTALPAVVLPRPPSSPNYIPQEYLQQPAMAGKEYAEKALYQNANVGEKPDTQQDYR